MTQKKQQKTNAEKNKQEAKPSAAPYFFEEFHRGGYLRWANVRVLHAEAELLPFIFHNNPNHEVEQKKATTLLRGGFPKLFKG
ncbi:MAG: hypothetical protein SH856_01615 [Flavobacteriales bacterium]|nr:hypothetical protein [Flavobacteriales bacterium]